MDKYFVDKQGRTEEYIPGIKGKKEIHFPLCLAIKYGNDVPMDCADFLLDTSKGKLFVPTEWPLPAGSSLTLHFYIPPKTKLLAEFRGKVIETGRINNIEGNVIKIQDFMHRRLHMLEDYLEEKKHLIDETV